MVWVVCVVRPVAMVWLLVEPYPERTQEFGHIGNTMPIVSQFQLLAI
jgi:hypothetical protein